MLFNFEEPSPGLLENVSVVQGNCIFFLKTAQDFPGGSDGKESSYIKGSQKPLVPGTAQHIKLQSRYK